MWKQRVAILAGMGLLALVSTALAQRPIRLAESPALSPDGKTLAFTYEGEIWSVPTDGGAARLLTRHPARDKQPAFSPDGKELAFISDRLDGSQVHIMSAEGGPPRQVTFHTEGYSLGGYYPDGQSLLVSARRDHDWYSRRTPRFYRVNLDTRAAEELLFDGYGQDGSLSPDGKSILFTREGEAWWRKGYSGSQSSQIWMFNLEDGTYQKLIDRPEEGGARWPLWKADGKGFYYVARHKGAMNLWERDLSSGKDSPLTEYDDDTVVQPCISRDGSTLVFRHLFDFYRFRPGKDDAPARIEIVEAGDDLRSALVRRSLDRASDVAFTNDGLEVAFISGGDLWVMDTELREPRQVTRTAEEERSPVFSPDGTSIWLVSDAEGQTDILRVERGNPDQFWWQNESFKLDKMTSDAAVESDLSWSPDGSLLAYLRERGDLWTMKADGGDAKRVVESWGGIEYDWSPDGKWVVFARPDEYFNDDVWVLPLDGSREPYNLSRHPDSDGDPAWSPDGKVIAFTGRRADGEVDIHFVFLTRGDDQVTTRDRTLVKAIEKMTKNRKDAGASPTAKPEEKNGNEQAEGAEKKPEADKKLEEAGKKKLPEVVIDFEGIHDRVRRVSVSNSTENGLFWSPDGKKLAFSARVDGKSGIFTISIPEELGPKPLGGVSSSMSRARWLEKDNQIVGLSSGVPASVSGGGEGKETSYRFRALQEYDPKARYRAAFDQAWRVMRDRYYDEHLGNKNWDAVRRKYADAAAEAPSGEVFGTIVNMMLGELNGSHLGFTPSARGVPSSPDPTPTPDPVDTSPAYSVSTVHLGVRFDPDYKGPGLKVSDVLPEGPADREASRIAAGEVILSIDGRTVDPQMDLTEVLNGRLDRDLKLVVKNIGGEERNILLRPISYNAVTRLLYEKWIKDNQALVNNLSDGKLGYLHIQGMNFSSFYRFEQELYAVGAGKEGLLIDVRDNGGGSTADHLLTALTQPLHAITVARGGKPGYPQDRKVYATWDKPIVVLCNQNSFSNAEIFSHAIKTLKRGKLVGVTTAGGVISTGGTSIMDVGYMRLPTRGWFLINDGQDMELNGCVPDVLLWPDPAQQAAGKDEQLEKAVAVLQQEVEEAAKVEKPKLRKATER